MYLYRLLSEPLKDMDDLLRECVDSPASTVTVSSRPTFMNEWMGMVEAKEEVMYFTMMNGHGVRRRVCLKDLEIWSETNAS